jgi:hypothetical protein
MNLFAPAALDGFLKVVGQAYDFGDLINVPDDRLFLANVSPQLFSTPFSMDSLRSGNLFKQLQQLNLTEALNGISGSDLIQELGALLEGQNITLEGLTSGDVLEQLAKQFTPSEGMNLTERIANAARQTAVQLNSQLAKASKAAGASPKSAIEQLQELQEQAGSSNRFQPILQNLFSKILPNAQQQPAAAAAAAGRKLHSQTDDAEPESDAESPEDAAEKITHLNSIRASLRELSKLARAQAALEQSRAELLNGTTEGQATRKLKQKGPLGPDEDGESNAEAFRLIFSNLFDFFYDPEDDGDADGKFAI